MRYRQLGRTGIAVSEIGLGTMMFGEKTEQPEAVRIIHQALDSGVNLIDVADVYSHGLSEQIVGEALKGRRSEALLATKVGRSTPLGQGLSRAYIVKALDASLQRLQTDYIDLYQVHRWDDRTPIEESLETLDFLVKQGKIRFIGCSNFEPWHLHKSLIISDARGMVRFETIQPRYNLLFPGPQDTLFPLCTAEQLGVLAFSPLAGGVLTGKYLGGIPEGSRAWNNPDWQANRLTPRAQSVAEQLVRAAAGIGRPPGQVAIRWCLAHPAVSSVLVGPRSSEQWAEALDCATWSLTAEETKIVSDS